jgi:cell division septation protein DedD
MADDGFQEIHLGNKQLVFLAMTGVVVLVVAFLFGVLVGRGVRSQETAEASADPAPAGVESPAALVDPAPATAPPSAAPLSPPEPVDDELSYPQRLEGQPPAGESIAAATTPEKPASPPPAPPAKATPPPAAAAPKADAAALTEPSGQGYAVQIVALRDRAKAEAVARRLASKGHRAYVAPPTGRRGMYRVLVGKFKSRQEAEVVSRRIEKEEQFKPWIIR